MKTLQLKIPPVIVTLLTAVCMWITARLFPVFIVDLPLREIMVSLLSISGGIVSALGILLFMLAKTSVNPKKFDTVSSLVVSGIYSVTRNPMYLGLLLVLLGWSYFLSNILAFVFIPIFVL
jgi:protein-S-isoprenylcysteine O-methyltransferase Ste14